MDNVYVNLVMVVLGVINVLPDSLHIRTAYLVIVPPLEVHLKRVI